MRRYIQIWHRFFIKSKFLSFMTKVNPNNGNETESDILHETYTNLTSLFIGDKICKYSNDLCNWHLSISLQKWAQTSKTKQNWTEHVEIWHYFSLFAKYYFICMNFEICLLIRFVTKMNDNSSRGKVSSI